MSDQKTNKIYACGIDLGTMFLQAAREDQDGNLHYNTVRDCYRELEYDSEFEDTLKTHGSHYVKLDQKLYVLGNDAYSQAKMAEFGADIKPGQDVDILKRPMKDGVLNQDSPKIAMTILRELMRACLDQGIGPARPGEILYFSIPANPVDSAINNVFHAKMAEAYLSSTLGYDARPLGEGLAVVYAENPLQYLPDNKTQAFTGIGLSFGAGQANFCLAERGLPIDEFSVARCLSDDFLVQTSSGVKQIKDVTINDSVYSAHGNLVKVLKVYNNGKRDSLISVELKGLKAFNHNMTSDHRILVKTGFNWDWKQASELNVGDIVGCPTIKYDPDTSGQVYMFGNTKLAKSRNLGRFFGAFLGDGSCMLYESSNGNESGRVQLAIDRSDEDTIDKYKSVISSIFGREASISNDPKENMTRILLHWNDLALWLKSNLYSSTKEKQLPFSIDEIPDQMAIGIIEGLFDTDGYRGTKQMTLSNTSKNIIFLAHNLLNRFGIRHWITERDRTGEEHLNPKGVVIKATKPSYELSIIGKVYMNMFDTLTGSEGHRLLNHYPDFMEYEITSLKSIPYGRDVYDISVDSNHHSFASIGMTVHNCGDWIDTNVARMTGQPKTKVLRVKERELDFRKIDPDNEILLALQCYYEEMVRYVFTIFAKRFQNNRGSIDHPIDLVLSGGTASPPGFDGLVRKTLGKMNLPFEIQNIRLAGNGDRDLMLKAVAKGCYIRAKHAAKKAVANKAAMKEIL